MYIPGGDGLASWILSRTLLLLNIVWSIRSITLLCVYWNPQYIALELPEGYYFTKVFLRLAADSSAPSAVALTKTLLFMKASTN